MKQDAVVIQTLAGPEYFDCEKLAERLSARQCLLNQGMVKGTRWAYSGAKFKLDPCLDCATGRRMRAFPPEVE